MGKRAAMVLAVVACLAACRTYPRWNEPLGSGDLKNAYRFENLDHADNSDSLFVILTFSGGGTRAAALAYGVLEELSRTEIAWEGRSRRLLDEVDVISAVSGGSLTAMYYGLYGDRVFAEFPQKVLYRDVQGEFIDDLRRFRNYVKLASPFYGRSDLLAEWFHEGVFDRQTYGDLARRGRRPFIVVNATDLGVGLPFQFTQNQFDLIHSNLSRYPVGNAVAASASFPGLLTPLTLQNFAWQADVSLPEWAEETLEKGEVGTSAYQMAEALDTYLREDQRYIHLVDGGVSDNLGLLPVIHSLRGTDVGPGLMDLLAQGRVKKVVIITVNAMAGTTTSWSDTPEIIDLLTVLGAVTSIPLGNFAQMQIDYLHLLVEDYQARGGREGRPPVGFTLVDVAFYRVQDGAHREFLKTIPTTFALPAETVDYLRATAGQILDSHPAYQELLKELR